jgi:GlcNAc-PI de-N-acetylase
MLIMPLATKSQLVPAPEILRQLHSFREMGSVLYIAAHPDDENTELITYFARGRNYRTAYLSLTRGDGGQNVLGPQFGNEIGAIRTQELLAARHVDGGRQFFSRAIDFGFSKDYRETLRIWDRQQVLSDIVRVIRLFRPDVLITRFSPVPGAPMDIIRRRRSRLWRLSNSPAIPTLFQSSNSNLGNHDALFGTNLSTSRMMLEELNKCESMSVAMIRSLANHSPTLPAAAVPCTGRKVSVTSPSRTKAAPGSKLFSFSMVRRWRTIFLMGWILLGAG